MKPEEFKKHWTAVASAHNQLTAYTYEELSNCAIKESSKEFLTIAGLPDSCRPYLSFNEKIYSPYLRSLKEILSLRNDDFAYHYEIGSSDNVSICINANHQDEIIIVDVDHAGNVDHRIVRDYPKRYRPIQFMNSSIGQLAECLLTYSQFWLEVRQWQEEGRFNEDKRTVRIIQLQSAMRTIDAPCMEAGAYWEIETDAEMLFD